jgi:hypothetical protein
LTYPQHSILAKNPIGGFATLFHGDLLTIAKKLVLDVSNNITL